jgi:hypothetical protein
MSGDLFSSEPVASTSFFDGTCDLCTAAAGIYNWGNLCCRARFVTSLPGIDLRRGWMARWKSRETPSFYAAIARAVKAQWEIKTGVAHG